MRQTWLSSTAVAMLFSSPVWFSGTPVAAQSEGGGEIQTADAIPVELRGSDIRPEVAGLSGAVVSEHPLASQVGYEVLRAGGNAVDAAVSMAAMLTVVRPHMNSVGGDSFVLFYEGATGAITALNASGRAAALATPEFYSRKELTRMPVSGPLSITVPGAVSAWDAALARYGTLSLSEALQPAIAVAERGFMVTSTLAEDLAEAAPKLNFAGREIYYPGERAIEAGEILRSPDLAQSLRKIANQGPSVLYGGELGATIAEFLEIEGSPLRLEDFAAHQAEWSTPAAIPFHGRNVHTVRPNSQGIVLLQMLAMAENLPLDQRGQNSSELLHELIEITKIAFADRDRWVADTAFADVPVDELLSSDYLESRAELITEGANVEYVAGLQDTPDHTGALISEDGDTVYLMVVDSQGNAVSWVQSLYSSFGSRLVVPGTGIALQNRGAGFSLENGHPNQVAPGKRPFHTLMAGMVTDAEGKFLMTIGTPGGGGQPQFLAQALINTLVYGMSPQAAVEAPRFRIGSGREVSLDSRMSAAVRDDLLARGHDVTMTEGWTADYGSVQMIQRLPNGVLRTGADMRREGTALAY